MTTTSIIHSATIKNNCPLCFNTEGLEFTFNQEITETKFYKNSSKDLIEKLFCHNCNNTIYPERWDKHIELVYEYHRKLAEPKHVGMSLKPITFGLIVVGILLFAAAVIFVLY